MTQELIVRPRDDWQTLQQEAQVALQSGYLPPTIKTPAQAIAIAMAGRELGISVWRALNGINIISGKTSLSSELMAELIYTHHGGRSLIIESSTATDCTISYQRKDGGPRRSYTYTMVMAERAGLGSNANYKKNPEAMLRARCISSIARMAFPDTIAGCYVEGEIVADEETPVRVVEEAKEPLQLNARNADTVTGEIAATPEKPPEPWQLEKIKGYAPAMLAFFGRKIKQTPATFTKADEQLVALDAALEVGPPSGHTPATGGQWQLTMEAASAAKERGREFEIPEEGCSVAELYAAYRKLTHGGLTDAEFMGTDTDASLEGIGV